MESQLPSRFSRCRNDGSNKTFAIIDLTKCRRNLRRTRTQEKGEAQSSRRNRGGRCFVSELAYRVVQYRSSEYFAKLHEKIGSGPVYEEIAVVTSARRHP